jgi:predicted RecA/RadA family phage recombinase
MEGDYFSFWGGEMTHGAWTGHERGQFYEADASQTKYIANNNKWYVHYAFQRFTSLQTFDTYFGCTYALARNGATYLPNGAGLQLSAGARQYLLLNDTTLDIRRTKIAVGLVPSAQNAQNAGLITMGSYSTGFLTVSFVGKSLEATILTIQAGNVMRQVAQTAQVGKLEAGQQYLVNVVWEAAPTFAVTLTVGTGAAGDNPVSATMAAPCAMYDLYKHDSRMLCAYGRHPNDIVPTFDGVLKLVAVGFL